MIATPRILSVGQCGADTYRLARFVRTHADAHLDSADSAAHALELLASQRYDLILVNRIFDQDGSAGVDFITQARTASAAPLMLVSDYPDAQSAATAAGALPGFGKSELHDTTAITRLRQALNLDSPA